MFKLFSIGFWETAARLILRNRFIILFLVVLTTVLFGLQWNKMRFTYTEANLLPDDHEVNINYNNFLKTFGDEGNLIVLAIQDSTLFTVDGIRQWGELTKSFEGLEAVSSVSGIGNLKQLTKSWVDISVI